MKKVNLIGASHPVSKMAIITAVWVTWAFFVSGCSPAKNTLFHERMSKFVPEFDRLNMEVLAQIPAYPGAHQAHIRAGGSHDPLTPTPRTLGVYYISDDLPSQIYEFLANEMLAQGWQTEKEDLSTPDPTVLQFWRGYACVEIRVRLWDANASSFTHYQPSSFDETPVSWYKLSIKHELNAVSGAPMPPEGQSLFECKPDSE